MASFVTNFHSRILFEYVQYVEIILYPEAFDLAFHLLFPFGVGD